MYEFSNQTYLKLNYRHGYRTPDAVYYQSNLTVNAFASLAGLPRYYLKSETMDSLEFNFLKQFSHKVEFGLNIFHNTFKNQLAWSRINQVWGQTGAASLSAVGSPGGMFSNLASKEQSMGGELLIDWKKSITSGFRGSYSHVYVGDDLAQRIPIHMIKLDHYGSLATDKFNYSLNVLFGSSMNGVGNPNANNWHESYKQNSIKCNLKLTYLLTQQSFIYFKAHNILEDDRPTMTFASSKPARGYLGSDERRLYLGYQKKF